MKILLKRTLPFCLALAVGIILTYSLQMFESFDSGPFLSVYGTGNGVGIGKVESLYKTGSDSDIFREQVNYSRAGTNRAYILFIPRPLYTDEAKRNSVSGTVLLRTTLLANGKVGSIIPIVELPHGLTENAVAAANEIVFEPATIDDTPTSVDVFIQYRFSL